MESRRRAALAVLALALVAAIAVVPFAFEGADAGAEIEVSDHVTVVGDPDAVGKKVTLLADEKYVQGSGNAAVLYTFNGWYAGGVLKSSDSVYIYTVVDGEQIVAKYTAEIPGSSQGGVDPMVLIIGICAVVVAIAAVVFAVVGKKEKA